MNSGKANKAAIRLILWSLAALVGLFVAAWIGFHFGGFILAHPTVLLAPWAIFIIAVLYLSRDPDPVEPSDLNAIVSPAHGKVDVIEDSVESEFMKGACRRISIRVSLLDVQVQNAPLAGTVAHFEYRRAMKDGGARGTENLFIGLDVIGRAGYQNRRAPHRRHLGQAHCAMDSSERCRFPQRQNRHDAPGIARRFVFAETGEAARECGR